MRQTLQLKLSQSLKMTPQLQQAIRLLQLSTLELRTEIQETLETNPLLEVDEGDTEAAEESGDDSEQQAETPREKTDSESVDLEPAGQDIPDDLPVDTQWDDIYEGQTSFSAPDPEAADRDFLDFQTGGGENLHDHLLSQLHLSAASPRDRTIATAIIEALDDAGYLTESLADLRNSLAIELGDSELDEEEIETALHLVQQFDPLGVGARDLAECLGLQLDQLPPDTPHRDTALRLLEHLDLVAASDMARLKRKLRAKEPELREAIALLRTLNPHPGHLIEASTSEYVIPDVFVSKQDGRWEVELNPEIAPRLRINNLYASMIKRGDRSQDGQYLRAQMQEARWFIKSLLSRNETLLRVAREIVRHQQAFFEYGEEAMRPLVLREIAEEVEMHESTISRVTTQKYMHTPRGVFEFKYFFSSHVKTTDGGECSATAIRAMIRKLVDAEEASKPLSDSKLATILEERGIRVARRTVAKYRESMNIPSSTQRRRLA